MRSSNWQWVPIYYIELIDDMVECHVFDVNFIIRRATLEWICVWVEWKQESFELRIPFIWPMPRHPCKLTWIFNFPLCLDLKLQYIEREWSASASVSFLKRQQQQRFNANKFVSVYTSRAMRLNLRQQLSNNKKNRSQEKWKKSGRRAWNGIK